MSEHSSNTPSTQKASKWPQILATLSASIGSICLGCGIGWTSPVLPNLTECENNPEKPDGCTFPDHEFSVTQGSWISGVYPLGAMASSLVTGFILTDLPRRRNMLLMAIPMIAGWILLALTVPLNLDQAYWFYIGRILAGFGGTSFALSAPLYVMEISEPEIRGSLATIIPFMITSGNVIVNGLGSLMSWDILTIVVIAFPVTMFVMMLLMPESPYSHISRGHEAKARKSLQWLRGKHYNIEGEIETLKVTHEIQEEIGRLSFKKQFTKWIYLQPMLIVMVIHAIQQFTGINAVVFYLADIFLDAGFNIEDSLSAAALVTLTQLVATSVSILVIDRTGRKVLLLISTTGMCIFILMLGVFFFLKENVEIVCDNSTSTTDWTFATNSFTTEEEGNYTEVICEDRDGYSQDLIDDISWLPLFSLICYKFFYALGVGPIPWVINGEFFSLEAKSTSAAICTAFNWACTFIVTTFTKDLEAVIGIYGIYFLFSVTSALSAVFIFAYLPETRGRSPAQMRAYFENPRTSKWKKLRKVFKFSRKLLAFALEEE